MAGFALQMAKNKTKTRRSGGFFIYGNVKLVCKCSQLVLDVVNGLAAPGTNAIQWNDIGGLAQQWKLTQLNGYPV